MVAGLLLVAGCNTVKGMGQDIKKAGEKIEGAAQK
jgi:predicted small secreted protein